MGVMCRVVAILAWKNLCLLIRRVIDGYLLVYGKGERIAATLETGYGR